VPARAPIRRDQSWDVLKSQYAATEPQVARYRILDEAIEQLPSGRDKDKFRAQFDAAAKELGYQGRAKVIGTP
jgi:hypothetical protein